MELFAVLLLVWPHLYAVCPSWCKRSEYFRVSIVPNPPVLEYHSNLVVDERPDATGECTFLSLSLLSWPWCNSFTQRSGPSLDITVRTRTWVNVV